MDGFYYLHTDGNLIFKPAVVAESPDYFDSPFVKKVWRLDLSDRLNAWRIVLEALSMGCRVERAKELAEKWGLTFNDSIEMLKRMNRKEISEGMIKGMDIFIKEILGMGIEAFWAKVKEGWNGKMDGAGDKGQAEKTG